jgi:hypothetical protein
MTKWLPWLVGAVVVVFIAYEFGPAIWNALVTVVTGIVNLVIAVIVWISSLFVAGFALVVNFVIAIAAALIVGVALAVALGISALLVIEGTRLLSHRVAAMTAEMHALKMEFRGGATDAAFIAILSLISGLLFYMVTEDFMKAVSTNFSGIRFLAASSVGYCIAKLFLLFPARLSKIGGVALTCLIFVGSAIFLNVKFDLLHDAVRGFPALRGTLAKEEPINWIIGAVIALFAALSLLYPFTLNEWKRMLSIPRPNSGSALDAEAPTRPRKESAV